MEYRNRKYSITLDIDWAPDFSIEYCLNLFDEFSTKATFFTTHQTDLNDEIVKRGHTLGIHPNFLANSSHGTNVIEIVENCLEFAPRSWCMRTHGLVQSTPLLHQIFASFSQLKLDVSLLMHRSEHAHKGFWELDGVRFERLMYNWEDDLEFYGQRFSYKDPLFFGNLTVFDFHPIHIVLNSSDGSEYRTLKETLRGENMRNAKKADVEQLRNPKIGVENYLKRVLASEATCLALDEI